MSDSVYRVIEFVGTSRISWEDAVKNAVETANKKYSDLRIGEVKQLDVTVEGGKIQRYRARVNMSFRYHLD